MARVRTIALASVLLLLAGVAFGQNFRIPASVWSSGGRPGASTTFRLNGTAGQPVQGTGLSTGYKGYWGFWYQMGELGNVGVTAILSPTAGATIDTGASVTPQVKFRNYSTTRKANFTGRVKLFNPEGSEVYDEAIGVSQLLPRWDTTLTFPAYGVGTDTGVWTLRAFAQMPGDTHPQNDTLSITFNVKARPPWPLGWSEAQPIPGIVKDGGWLAMHTGNGLIYAACGNKSGGFYSYNVLESTWTTLTAIPNGTEAKPPYKGAVGVTNNDRYVYATKGNNTMGFWRYHIDSLTWTQMPDVPYGPSGKKVKGGTDMVFVQEGDTGWVYLLKGVKTDFFRFNTVTGRWDTTLPPAPAGMKDKWDKGSWLVYDGGNTIYAHKAKYHELWAFDVATHTWGSSPLPGMPLVGMMGKSKKSKDGGSAAFDAGAIWALKGGNTQEFWKYTVATGTWTELETIPSYGSTLKKKRVKAGGDICAWGGGVFFALKGNKTLEFWQYTSGAALSSRILPGETGEQAGRTQAEPGLLVAPNPAVDAVTVQFQLPAAGLTVSLYDVTGRCVVSKRCLSGAGLSGVRLGLGGIAPGVYLLKLEGTGVVVTDKLIVTRGATGER
ncbi:MAG: T9SS type A sorting domain-containing protein [candidate division WOR-3 bacterium]